MFSHGSGMTVGVVGACGGVGASTFAAALARQVARSAGERTVLVDLAGGGGIDVLLGIEELPGLRWADLRGARGEVAGTELVDLMPRWGDVLVLSADRARPEPVPEVMRSCVLGALAGVGNCVVDLSGGDVAAAARCDRVLVVVPRDLRAIAGAQAVLAALRSVGVGDGALGLVVRGPAPGSLDPDRVSRVLGVPVVTQLLPDRGLPFAVEHGVGPQGRRLDRAAKRAGERLFGVRVAA